MGSSSGMAIPRARPQRWAVEERGQRKSLCPSETWSEVGHRGGTVLGSALAEAGSLEGLPLPAELLHGGGGWGQGRGWAWAHFLLGFS